MSQATPIRVILSCTGVGIYRGGHETFGEECYKNLKTAPGMEVRLAQSIPATEPTQHKVWCLNRTTRGAAVLGKLLRRPPYAIEQMTSIPGLLRLIRRHRAHVLFTSEANLIPRMVKLRRLLGWKFAIIHSNGAPMIGANNQLDMTQQVTPEYYDKAIAAGGEPKRHRVVPYGAFVPDGDPDRSPAGMLAARKKLGLPENRPMVLSVGWVSPTHKRMDHMVREVAAIPGERRPYLLMLGRLDDSTEVVRALGNELLGAGNFDIRSAPAAEVVHYYHAADVFALASLVEGFGRVYAEALVEGVPCVVHDGQVMRFVLGDQGTFVDMAKPGELSAALREQLSRPDDPAAPARRRDHIRQTFSWKVLAPAYLAMFRAAAENAGVDLNS
jgi:1,2-diacylglycerol 3-alpha-glucosyltransferase